MPTDSEHHLEARVALTEEDVLSMVRTDEFWPELIGYLRSNPKVVQTSTVCAALARLHEPDMDDRSLALALLEECAYLDNDKAQTFILDAITYRLSIESDSSFQSQLTQALKRITSGLTSKSQSSYPSAVSNEAAPVDWSDKEMALDSPTPSNAHVAKTDSNGLDLSDTYNPSLRERGILAFERDLPELMRTHHLQHVAYHGEFRIGPARTLPQLDRLIQRKNIRPNECVFRTIRTQVPLNLVS